MADNEPITKLGASSSVTGWATLFNAFMDKRLWVNRTDVTATTYAVAEDGSDQLIYADGTSNVVSIELPASADVPGMVTIVYVKNATFAVTITLDGADTINQVAANPVPAVATARVLVSLGDGDWLMWSTP